MPALSTQIRCRVRQFHLQLQKGTMTPFSGLPVPYCRSSHFGDQTNLAAGGTSPGACLPEEGSQETYHCPELTPKLNKVMNGLMAP
jgi:hypothetical protein